MSDQSMLDQLKNDGNDTDRGFMPTVTMDQPQEPVQQERVEMPVYPETVVSKAAQSVRKRVPVEERVVADLSGLPDPIPEVEDKGSIVKEIFKEGGDFDQMMERRTAEMQEMMNDPKFVADAEKALQMVDDAANRQQQQVDMVDDSYDDFYDDPSDDEPIDTSDAQKVTFGDTDDYDEEDDSEKEGEYVPDNSAAKIVATEVTIEPTIQDDAIPTSDGKAYYSRMPGDVTQANPQPHEGIIDENLEVKTAKQEKSDNVVVEEIDDDDEEAKEEARLKYFREEVTKKLKPISKKLDITGYAVVKKSTKPSILAEINNYKLAQLAKWPLINTGIIATFKEIPGVTLELVRTHINNNDAFAILNIVYDYIVGPKPLTFEAWAKSIDAQDYDHMFMGFYIACFLGSNFLPMDCTNSKCPKGVFLTDDINFAKMVKFGNTEAKKKFNKINREEPTNPEGLRVAYRAAISEHLAADFTRPSLYSEYVEMGYLQERYIRNHQDIIDYVRFIENLYEINPKTHQLEEIYYEVLPDNPGRTTINKINAWTKHLRTLTVDELACMRAYINELAEKTEEVTYVRPEATCPHCKTVVPEQEMTATGMVFLRNQLGLLMTISEN